MNTEYRNMSRRLTMTALCIACSVVACRIMPDTLMVRIDFGFLPIVLAAYLYGPVYSGGAYLIADLVGCLIVGDPINPFISLCKLATGVILGLALRRRAGVAPTHTLRLMPVLCTMTLLAVVVDYLCMATIFVLYFQQPLPTAALWRGLTALVNLPIRIALTCLMGKFLAGKRGRIIERF